MSTEHKVNPKFITILIILAFLIVGGIFTYDYLAKTKGMPEKEERKVEAGTSTIEEWGAMKGLEVPSGESKEISE